MVSLSVSRKAQLLIGGLSVLVRSQIIEFLEFIETNMKKIEDAIDEEPLGEDEVGASVLIRIFIPIDF